MRYFFKKPERYNSQYGIEFKVNHPVYNSGTLYKIGDKGLVVIQQRFDSRTKSTRWGPIDPEMTDVIYLNPKFQEYFDKMASEPWPYSSTNTYIYPTVTLRQIMWALRMKPLKKELWETVFDRSPI